MGFGRKGPWVSLEILDEGRQKPTPVTGDPVLSAWTLIQKVVPGLKDRGITGAPVGLIDVKASKILAYRCMPKYSSGHAGHESGGSRLTADNHVPPERDDGFRVLPLVSLILRNCLPA